MKRLLAVAVLVIAGCTTEPPPTVVVYAPAGVDERLDPLLAEAGFDVEWVTGDIATLTDSIIAKQDSPRADVLFTSSVIDIWRAGDQGALRPLEAAAAEQVPAELRDPDGTWAATSHQPLLIGFMPGAQDAGISTYADLGSQDLAGKLCMTTSELPRNRVLLGMLIEDLGLKPAERAVRLWARNLAQPPFATEEDLAAALSAGTCEVAIISSSPEVAGLVRVTPDPVYRDIHGIGVTRHSEQPGEAHKLVAWMLRNSATADPESSNGRNVSIAGWRTEEARLLAERAGYR